MSLKTNVGAPDSTSFITLSEAEDYLDAFGDDITDWSALTEAQQEMRLTLAAEAIGTSFPFRGYKAYAYQALAFPRVNCQDYFSIPLDEIPEQIKKAQAYIAFHIIHKHLATKPLPTDTDALPTSNMNISSFSVRGISVSFRDAGGEGYTSALETIMSDENSMVYLLLNRFMSQIRFTQVGDTKPTLLEYEEPETTTTTTTSTTSTTTSSTTTGTTTSSTTTTTVTMTTI